MDINSKNRGETQSKIEEVIISELQSLYRYACYRLGSIDEGGDFISLRLKTKQGKSELGGIFSRKQGQLLECGVRILNEAGEWEKVLSAKIEYDYVVSKEQITSSPK